MYKDNVVYIGKKDPMSYVMAVMRNFNDAEIDEVVLKARGRSISTAVDVAEITRNRFLTDLVEPRVEISTEELPDHGGETRNVSSISIHLTKEAQKIELPSSKGIEISEIKGVGEVTEKRLKEAGYDTLEAITQANAQDLSEKIEISLKKAENLIESAVSLLNSS
jgi:DNA-binding protein